MCTLGPATTDQERLTELIRAGMNVARFNMSHGDYNDHSRRLANLRAAVAETGQPVGLLADLQGPKIRLGTFAEKSYKLSYGQTFTITTEDIVGDQNRSSTTYKGLPQDVSVGDPLLIDDGNVALEAIRVTDTEVVCTVKVAGKVSNHKGINLPGVAVSVPAMSQKDEDDLRWAMRNGFDLVALSFVRDAADVEPVRRIMAEEGRKVPVIAKVEKPQAVEAIDEVIDAFDAIMVARGDLGVELPLEQVPIVQKSIISKARVWAKPVIVATQMLESMISAPRPTRAEASDVANAILDGADAVMLSGETSIGQYPVVTVETMARIVENTESTGIGHIRQIDWDPHTTSGVIAKAALEVGERLSARCIVAFTKSGDTARRLARFRSELPLVVFTPERQTQQALTLVWGVNAQLAEEVTSTDAMVHQVDVALGNMGTFEVGERVVIVSGSPVGLPGKTNALRVHRVKPPTVV